jgi:mannose-6-phosphate isomerase-like protein (cupin superfamily)
MGRFRKIIVTGVAVVTAGTTWQANSATQENAASRVGVVTVFDRSILDASFARALAGGGTSPLWSRTSAYGTSEVSVHSRESTNSACPPQGCSHKSYTAVVIVVSGVATLEVGGTAKAAADKFGGQLVQGGESRRISQGDIFIMPPDTMHWYKDVTAPFRYIEVPVP